MVVVIARATEASVSSSRCRSQQIWLGFWLAGVGVGAEPSALEARRGPGSPKQPDCLLVPPGLRVEADQTAGNDDEQTRSARSIFTSLTLSPESLATTLAAPPVAA